MTAENSYRVLEIQPGASPEEIKLAYRDMAQVWHPDRFANSPHLQQKALDKMKQINAAYEFLKTYTYRPDTTKASTRNGSQSGASTRANGPTTRTNTRAYSQPLPDEVWKFRGHSALVSSVAFAPDGLTVVSGSYDKTVRLWSVRTGLERRWLLGHEGAVMGVAVSRDGRSVLSGSVDKSLRLWDTETKQELQFFGAGYVVRCVALSPDGRLALSGSVEGPVQLWDVATGRELQRFAGDGFINSVAFSPDGQRIAFGSANGNVCLYELSHGQRLLSLRVERGGIGQMLESVVFSPAGSALLTAGPASLIVWESRTGRELGRIELDIAGVTAACFVPGAHDILTGHTDSAVRLWTLETRRVSRLFRGHEAEVKSVAVAPGGRFAVSGSADKTVRLWRLQPDA